MRAAILCFLLAPLLFGHKLNIFTDYKDGLLFIQSYYANGNPCSECRVKVLDDGDKELFTGALSGEGKIERAMVITGGAKVVVDASGGHLAEAMIKIDQIVEPPKMEPKKESIDNEALQKMIESAVAKEVRPILVKMEQENEMSMEKIISGVGYILGFFGLVMFFRRKRD